MLELFLAHASCQEHPMSGQTPDLSAMLRRVAEIEVRGEGCGGGEEVMLVCPTDPDHCRPRRNRSV